MSKLKEKIKSSPFQLAFAAGISILAIAVFSTWVLTKPIDPFLLAIPPLIEAAYEGLLKKNRDAKYLKPWYWVCAILLSTVLIIVLNIVL